MTALSTPNLAFMLLISRSSVEEIQLAGGSAVLLLESYHFGCIAVHCAFEVTGNPWPHRSDALAFNSSHASGYTHAFRRSEGAGAAARGRNGRGVGVPAG
jgi:hypothetical protein